MMKFDWVAVGIVAGGLVFLVFFFVMVTWFFQFERSRLQAICAERNMTLYSLDRGRFVCKDASGQLFAL